ncbi:nitroimidazol reductase NimA-like FMN-containing flavoprotein (pyridoxamine 5'-phosphate oxidase superfamily) [Kitasatospora sp. MAP12-15]|uniref:pyridoxamine 5'-phosphate oxidase family protein n=1 Tax=unclassified Kitasatospora TaxID=2633591 RepID=UPI002476D1F0|nr:pyridoxamine 5'-phosphate oxidase family protein [Kitasatospora sp. MAP12-44]MDH6108995.1 nitroimidazol reductase NimA-like FMN-containing flavoprotein (pyridoxamine 5'-phosphate oxidase superfamily) [Kitasatospora sp. MAP12-44]
MSTESSASAAAPDAAAQYARTARTTPTRYKERASWEREEIHAVLDSAWVCHLGFIADGAPVVLPTIFARVDDRLYLHGSTGSRPLRGAGADEGMPVCVTVTQVDGLVLAKSAFNHSVNFRSVVAHGVAHQVTDPQERTIALNALVEQAVPGRSADCRPGNTKELAQTAVIRLVLDEVSAKVRADLANDDEEDLELPYWSGVVPVTTVYGEPVPHPGSNPEVPDYLKDFTSQEPGC